MQGKRIKGGSYFRQVQPIHYFLTFASRGGMLFAIYIASSTARRCHVLQHCSIAWHQQVAPLARVSRNHDRTSVCDPLRMTIRTIDSDQHYASRLANQNYKHCEFFGCKFVICHIWFNLSSLFGPVSQTIVPMNPLHRFKHQWAMQVAEIVYLRTVHAILQSPPPFAVSGTSFLRVCASSQPYSSTELVTYMPDAF